MGYALSAWSFTIHHSPMVVVVESERGADG